MRRLILGTAGHIDHGKTELVRALTGVDTDRLKEEKERGITIDLGFAELATSDDLRYGVVDVPGHEGFIRNMLAGATGMDLVLLVIAADEGVMPQTREHLSIATLLGVQKLVVALSKSDLVDPDWLELVRDDVRTLLAGTPYEEASVCETSARTGAGLDELLGTLGEVGRQVVKERGRDLVHLPIDRVFTVRGTGTVVTGTLWSGALRVGERVQVLPAALAARVRGLQVHGRDVQEARAGERTAVALSGQDIERGTISRGQSLVSDSAWVSSSVITARASVLADSKWELKHGQRVRVHLGTAERMARLVLLEREPLLPGDHGWIQLRLEAPVLARGRQRFVLRSYSPVSTVGGGIVAEPSAPKRARAAPADLQAFQALLEGSPEQAVTAAATIAGWAGLERATLPVVTGLEPQRMETFCSGLPGVADPDHGDETGVVPFLLADSIMDGSLVAKAVLLISEAVTAFHSHQPLRAGIDVETLRQALPSRAHPALADAVLNHVAATGWLGVRDGIATRSGFEPQPTPLQAELLASLAAAFRGAGLTPPSVSELPENIRDSPDLWPLLLLLERDGRLIRLDPELFVWSDALLAATGDVRAQLAGQKDLGPSDFRGALPISRKYLMPVLLYLDRSGVTVRRGNVRDVAPE